MTTQGSVCRLCCDTLEENNGQVIDEFLVGMFETVLSKDLTIGKHFVVCKKCYEKLEANYNFKRRCIVIENSIAPFVAENVKLNLREIHSQIIKLQDMENDKNVCRLCLQFVDNDMTLSGSEKEEFRRFFPEVNLSRTNFVILCITCYELLQKYFIFVRSCLRLEQQLYDYSFDKGDIKIDTPEHVSVKLENFQECVRYIKEEDNEIVLNEELDIKCDIEDDERYYITNQNVEQLTIDAKEESTPDKSISNSADLAKCICEECGKTFKENILFKKHILVVHADLSKNTKYHCEQCSQKFKRKYHLKYHMFTKHSDTAKTEMYQCEQCANKFTQKCSLKRHIFITHTDPSKISWSSCERCDRKFKLKHDLKRHILVVHTHPSELVMHNCEECGKRFKENYLLRRHILAVHGDISKIPLYQCEHCTQQFKRKGHLKDHISAKHTDPSKMKTYKCDQCPSRFKHKNVLKRHMLGKHTDPSEIIKQNCEQCDKTFKQNYQLKRHIRRRHTDPSKLSIYKCAQCSKQFKYNLVLKKHVQTKHADFPKIT